MSYKVNRALGYQPWGVTNPWVFADLSQPQRQRGRVSPMVFQTNPPRLMNHHLGQIPILSEEMARAQRMERYALLGLALSAGSFAMFAYSNFFAKRLRANRRRRSR